MPDGEHEVEFEEHERHDDTHYAATRDHNIRSAYIHVIADAAVSVLAIIGLGLARTFGWLWMDPLAGVIGALVIANSSYGLTRGTGAILLDINPDRRMAESVRQAIEDRGDKVVDLHVWRVGPGLMSAVVSVGTSESQRDARFYHVVLERNKGLSHLTVEVQPSHASANPWQLNRLHRRSLLMARPSLAWVFSYSRRNSRIEQGQRLSPP